MATYKQLTQNFLETGSDQDFAALYNKIKPGLTSYIYKIVKDREMAEDIAVNTLTKMWTKIEQYNPSYGITTWLYRIAFNDSLGYIKKRNQTTSLSKLSEYGVEISGTGSVSNTLKDLVLDHEEKTEQDYLEEDSYLQKQYESALESIKNLQPLYQTILEDRLLNNMKYEDIADKYGVPLQTVKNRIRRGKILIQESMVK